MIHLWQKGTHPWTGSWTQNSSCSGVEGRWRGRLQFHRSASHFSLWPHPSLGKKAEQTLMPTLLLLHNSTRYVFQNVFRDIGTKRVWIEPHFLDSLNWNKIRIDTGSVSCKLDTSIWSRVGPLDMRLIRYYYERKHTVCLNTVMAIVILFSNLCL